MTTPAPTDDIRVKVGSRRAFMSFSDQNMVFKFTNGSQASIPCSNVKHTLTAERFTGLVFHSPMPVIPGTKRAVRSIQLSAESDSQLFRDCLKSFQVVDMRQACASTTACQRKTVYIIPKHGIAIVGTSSCEYMKRPDLIILQRTQGGMSTYDVHLLHHGSNSITTVEMLPHSTLDMWEKHGMNTIDAGPDPVELASLRTYYHDDKWVVEADDFKVCCLSSDESDGCVSNSDSEYIDGESEASDSDSESDIMVMSATCSDEE